MAIGVPEPSRSSGTGSFTSSFLSDLSDQIHCAADRGHHSDLGPESSTQLSISDGLRRTLGFEFFVCGARSGARDCLCCRMLFLLLCACGAARHTPAPLDSANFRKSIRSDSGHCRPGHAGACCSELFDPAEDYRDRLGASLSLLAATGLVSWSLPAHAWRSRSRNARVVGQGSVGVTHLSSVQSVDLRSLLSPSSCDAGRRRRSGPEEKTPQPARSRVAVSESASASSHCIHTHDPPAKHPAS